MAQMTTCDLHNETIVRLQRELSEARAELEKVKRERDAKGKENDALRAMQVGVKCAYGYRMENGACQLGYPGCACMDDLCATIEWGPDDLHAQANKRLQERAERAESALAEAAAELPHCSGPIHERIAVYRKHYEDRFVKLKAHAEEMAHYTDCYKDKWPDSGAGYTLAAYRAAYPKE